jgi:hypothetical protein
MPKETTAGQAAQVVLDWLRAKGPENRKNYPAEGDVMFAAPGLSLETV